MLTLFLMGFAILLLLGIIVFITWRLSTLEVDVKEHHQDYVLTFGMILKRLDKIEAGKYLINEN